MKRIFFSLISAALILAGCAKEQAAPVGEGDLATVMFTASLENVTSTKAANDGDGQAANVNRCIMEVYYDGSLFGRQVTPVTDKKASFTMQVVSNRTYTVAFWADCVTAAGATPTAAELAEDLYYTTNAAQPNGGLQAIAMKGTYAGNKDSRDAFYAVDTYTIAQGGTQCNATLKRPFAQINVITTDWDKVSSIDALKPTNVDVTIKNPYTVFNAVTQEASTTVSSIKYNATVYSPAATGAEKTLSMDYLFASNEKEMIDIDFKAQKSGNDDVSHTFTAVPYQRNYRTNIKGALLTTTGQWNVTVDPIWATGDIPYEVVNDIADANEVIQNAIDNGQNEINVKFTSQPDDAGTPGATSGSITSKAIVTTGLPATSTLNILVEAETKDLYVGDYTSETNTQVITTGTNSAVVNINVPENSGIQKLVINAPSKTVYLNGVQMPSAGTIDILDVITSNNTLVIEAGQTVNKLIFRQGALKIFGTVTSVEIPDDHGDIYVRDCEGLSHAAYTVLEPYIDIDNSYAGIKKGEDNYDIVKGVAPVVAKIGEKNYYTLSSAFSAATTDQTIELQMNATLSSTISLGKSISFDMSGYDINVTAFGSAFVLDANGGLNVTNGSFTQGAPWSDGCGDDYNYFIFELKDNSALELNTVTCDGYNTHDGSLIRVNGGGGAAINLANSTFTTDNCVFNSYTATEQTTNTLIVNGCTFQSETNQSLNLYYINATIGKNGETKTQFSGLKGMNAYSGTVADLTEVVANCSGTCVYYADDSKGTLTNCDFTSTGHTIGTAGDVNRSIGGSKVTGDITINGGTYISHGSSNAVFKIFNSGGKITVNSGIFTNDNSGDLVYADSRNAGDLGTDTQPAWVIVNGGTLTGNLRFQHMGKMYVHGGEINGQVTLVADPKPLIVDGGTFPYNPENDTNVLIVDGYQAVANGTTPETWKVQKALPTYPGTTLKATQIGSVIWAPVNCGYDANHPYGLLYQWGRYVGGVYDGETGNVQSILTNTSESFTCVQEPVGNKMYPIYNNQWWYGWACKNNVTINYWPRTSADPGFIEGKIQDPCPEGWRIPTKAELDALVALPYTKVQGASGVGVDGKGTGDYYGQIFGTAPNQVFVHYAGQKKTSSTGGCVGRASGSRYGYLWTSESRDTYNAWCYHFSSYPNKWCDSTSDTSVDKGRTYARSIRCVMIQD